jgi:acyl CoA:acetate/3-ketoacid CoA transferase
MADNDPAMGYEVRPSTVRQARAASEEIGAAVCANVARVITQVQPRPAGWELGGTLLDLIPLWQRHLQTVGDSLQRNGANLDSNASTYTELERKHVESFAAVR